MPPEPLPPAELLDPPLAAVLAVLLAMALDEVGDPLVAPPAPSWAYSYPSMSSNGVHAAHIDTASAAVEIRAGIQLCYRLARRSYKLLPNHPTKRASPIASSASRRAKKRR